MSETKRVTIDLILGYTDLKRVKHTRVTLASRIIGEKLFEIDGDPQSSVPTQYQDLLLRATITEFGSLKMPVALSVLLGLDSIDREDLHDAFARFFSDSLGENKVEYLADNQVKLAIGYERNGLVYDLVAFGARLTGMDEVAADKLKLEGLRRHCYLAGKQVVSLSQSTGASVLEGPMPLEYFEKLDAIDIGAIRAASEVWRYSFRRPGASLQAVGSTKRLAAGNANRVERSADSRVAD
jgi:hypothetical protein